MRTRRYIERNGQGGTGWWQREMENGRWEDGKMGSRAESQRVRMSRSAVAGAVCLIDVRSCSLVFLPSYPLVRTILS